MLQLLVTLLSHVGYRDLLVENLIRIGCDNGQFVGWVRMSGHFQPKLAKVVFYRLWLPIVDNVAVGEENYSIEKHKYVSLRLMNRH